MSDNAQKTKLVGIFSMPGDGLVVELGSDDGSALYDKQGLQYRIIQRQQAGLDTSTEEIALSQMHNFAPVFDVS